MQRTWKLEISKYLEVRSWSLEVRNLKPYCIDNFEHGFSHIFIALVNFTGLSMQMILIGFSVIAV